MVTAITEHILKDGDRIELGKDRVPLLFTSDPTRFPDDDVVGFDRALLDLKLSGRDESTVLCKRFHGYSISSNSGVKALTSETAFDQILRSALKLSGAERAFILIRDQQKFSYATGMLASGARLEEHEFRTSRSVVDHVAKTGTAVFMVERFGRCVRGAGQHHCDRRKGDRLPAIAGNSRRCGRRRHTRHSLSRQHATDARAVGSRRKNIEEARCRCEQRPGTPRTDLEHRTAENSRTRTGAG